VQNINLIIKPVLQPEMLKGWMVRTTGNIIDGVVLTFINISEIVNLRAEKSARLYAEGILNTVREPLVILDKELRIISANRSFYRIFQMRKDETEGSLIYKLGNRQWDIPDLRELLEKILPEKTSFDNYTVEHEFPLIGYRKMLLNARQVVYDEGGQLILLAIEDVTEK